MQRANAPHKIYLKNNVVRSLRIDLGEGKGAAKLYNIRLGSFYGEKIILDAVDIYEKFMPNQHIDSFVLKNEYLFAVPGGNDPYIVSKDVIRVSNVFLSSLFPFLLTFLFWVVLSSVSFRRFPAFWDLNHKKSSMGIHIDSLDGIRGIAALMVLADHCGLVDGIGTLGVWIFFSLSGFLLVTPFVHDPAKAYSLAYMKSFLFRRLKRIVPMYYAFILIIMLFRVKNPEIFRHLMFLQGDGHLWSIPQELFFYLLLPVIMLLCCIRLPGQKIYRFVLISGLICISNIYLTADVVSLYGNGRFLRPFAGVFLSGVLCSYCYHWLYNNVTFQRVDQSVRTRCFSVAGICLVFVSFLLLAGTEVDLTAFVSRDHFGIAGLISAVFIFLVVMSEGALLGKMVGFLPLRAVGLVGFSFYLLHPTLMGFCRSMAEYYFNTSLPGFTLFLIAGTGTYLLSILTYTLIERPFLFSEK